MAGTGEQRAVGRLGRRTALLVALGLISSLGAAGALAAVVVDSHTRRSQGGRLAIRIAPANRIVAPGSTATYTVRVARSDQRPIGLSGRTSLSVDDGNLPTGAEASISSAQHLGASLAPGARTTLTVTTADGTRPGTYEVRLGAHRPHRSGSAVVELTISRPAAPGPPTSAPPAGEPPPDVVEPPPIAPTGPPVIAPDSFTIAGALPNLLTPGSGEPLDLTLTNLESTDLLIASLSVEVATVSGPQTDPSHTCAGEDFSVEQFTGAPGFTLPASSTADLGELGFDPSEWPTVSMLNRPVNQDGCKSASLSLSFTGTATEATP
jgi:hypothetical protein